MQIRDVQWVCVEFGGRKATTMVSEKAIASLLPKGWCIDSCVVFENFVHRSSNGVDLSDFPAAEKSHQPQQNLPLLAPPDIISTPPTPSRA